MDDFFFNEAYIPLDKVIVVDVRTNDSTLVDEFIQAHANDACCTEGEDD